VGHHSVQIVQEKSGLQRWRAFCSCKSGSELLGFKGDAEEWEFRHHKLVEQARVHLRDKTPSTSDQYDWYDKQARNPENSHADREQWRMLAEGLYRLLPHAKRMQIQSTEPAEPLPFEVDRLYRQPNRKGSQ
jgi:hypothetical protein